MNFKNIPLSYHSALSWAFLTAVWKCESRAKISRGRLWLRNWIGEKWDYFGGCLRFWVSEDCWSFLLEGYMGMKRRLQWKLFRSCLVLELRKGRAVLCNSSEKSRYVSTLNSAYYMAGNDCYHWFEDLNPRFTSSFTAITQGIMRSLQIPL